MTANKGWYFAGVCVRQTAKEKWEQIFHLEAFYASHDEPALWHDATHIAERHLKGNVKELVAPAWWNGKCFTLIMWRDKSGKIRKSRRRDHIKQFITPAEEGGSKLETRVV